MKSLLVKRMTAGASSLVSGILLLGAVNGQSQTTNIYVNPGAAWVGYMNWTPNPIDPPGDGGYGSSGWGTAALPAIFNGATLTLSPNVNVYDNTNDPYWVNPDGSGANIMDANFYVQDTNLPGYTITFSGYCHSNSLSTNYTCTAFIKDFSTSYSLNGSIATPFTNGQPFSITLATAAGDIIQYGFETVGPDANPATVASLGVVQVSSNSVALPPPATPTNNAPTPTRPASSVLAMYNSSGVYTNHPVERFLASWSGSAEAPYTIPGTGRTVLEYIGLQYAGVEFYDTSSGDNVGGSTDYSINASAYNTLHFDLWTSTANQFGVQLVSLNPTEPAEVDFLPASHKIVSNTWIGIDIPLSEFTATNSALLFSDLQQLLWIDNQSGGGVTSGNFYLDNIYFYTSAAAAPTPTLTASVNGGTVKLSFPTVSGYSYQVQYKNNLTDTTWTNLSTVTGDGTTHTVSDTPGQSHRYYRIHP